MTHDEIAAIDTVIDYLEDLIHQSKVNIDKAREVQDFLEDLITNKDLESYTSNDSLIDKTEEPVKKTDPLIVDPDYIHTFCYRGYEVPIYIDDYGQQYYCMLDGEEISFGAYNMFYEDDLIYLINRKFDKND